uniref:LigA n=1 Tax=Parastrongyloides trichosuri TaxID=131310 RepID=A0A0N4Z2V9_PARTI
MDGGVVALVAGEAVAGVGRIHLDHQPIPGRLGQDGRRRDGQGAAVALDHGRHRAGQLEAVVAVHQGVHRRMGQGLDRPPHGQAGGVQDVQLVDLLDRGEADAPGQGAGLDLGLQRGAALFRQGLGIIDSLGQVVGVQDHRRRRHRPGPRSPARLVDPADMAVPRRPGLQLQQQCGEGAIRLAGSFRGRGFRRRHHAPVPRSPAGRKACKTEEGGARRRLTAHGRGWRMRPPERFRRRPPHDPHRTRPDDGRGPDDLGGAGRRVRLLWRSIPARRRFSDPGARHGATTRPEPVGLRRGQGRAGPGDDQPRRGDRGPDGPAGDAPERPADDARHRRAAQGRHRREGHPDLGPQPQRPIRLRAERAAEAARLSGLEPGDDHRQ